MASDSHVKKDQATENTPVRMKKKRGGKRNEVRIDDRSKEKRQKKKVKYKCTIYLLLILFDSECA